MADAHLPFCLRMLEKVKHTSFEKKWQQMCDVISQPEKLTAEQNKRIDETITEIKREIQAQAQFETPAIPKKIDLASEHKTVSDSSSSDKSAKSVCIPTSSAKSIKRSHSNEVLQDTIEKKQKTTDGDLEKPVPLASEPNNIALTTPKIPTFKIKLNEINMKKVEKRLKKRQKKEAMVECENKRGVEFKTLSNETKTFEKHQSLQQLFSLKGLSIKVKRCPATSYSSENESSPQVIRDQIRSNFPTIVSVHEGVIENELMDITEIKMEPKETVPEPSSSPLYKWQKVPPKTHLVAHMSYRINNNHLFFKCHLCSFVPTESKNEFLTHLLRTHKYNRWFGGCNICSEELSTVGTLSDELTHMIEVHIKNDPLGTKCEEPSSGDVPMVSIPNYFLTANKTLVVNKRPKLLDGYTTMRKLKPWISTIKNIHQKYQQALDDMMKLECLSALFKCMGSDCSFYTCDGAHFQTHLSLHKVHQINDFKNFSCCSYCDFQTVDEVALTQHIIDVHASAKYQCSHCFYRSFSKQIEIHVNMHHRNLKKGFIEFDCSKEETLHAETIWQKCIKNVPSMCCMLCKGKFHNFDDFKNHLTTHTTIPSSKCLKCKRGIVLENIFQHLKICHGINDIQCGFCRFGTTTSLNYLIHMSNEHPHENLIYFDRRPQDLKKDELLKKDESSKLKLMQFRYCRSKRRKKFEIQKATDPADLESAANVTQLSRNRSEKPSFKAFEIFESS